MGGESRSTLPATDGGRPEADGDDGDSDDTAATDIDIDEVVESAEGDSAVDAEDADSVSDDVEVPDDSDIPDAEMDDLPTDEDGVVRPNFDTSDRDFSEPADRVDTGDYAVDSRALRRRRALRCWARRRQQCRRDRRPDGPRRPRHGPRRPPDHDHGHAGGPPAGGWTHIDGLDVLLGRESTWFTLAPILLTAMSLAVLLGVIPYEMGFLELIEHHRRYAALRR